MEDCEELFILDELHMILPFGWAQKMTLKVEVTLSSIFVKSIKKVSKETALINIISLDIQTHPNTSKGTTTKKRLIAMCSKSRVTCGCRNTIYAIIMINVQENFKCLEKFTTTYQTVNPSLNAGVAEAMPTR